MYFWSSLLFCRFAYPYNVMLQYSKILSNSKDVLVMSRTKYIVLIAMITAMAYIVGMFIRIRFMAGAPFLTYDPKDSIIVVGGFLFGPLATIIISFLLAFTEMITHSQTGPWGMLMNFSASAAFAFPAAFMYKRMPNIRGAVIGLVIGSLFATAIMLYLNYLIVPLFMPHVKREQVIDMLLPIFLPFNLIKTGINSAIVVIIYKPIFMALKATGVMAQLDNTKLTRGVSDDNRN